MTDFKHRPITSRYASLPLISLLIKLLGFLTLGFGVAIFLFGIFAMLSRGSLQQVGLFLLQLFGSLIVSAALIAASEVIHVLLDIEENTRRAADALTGQTAGTTPRIADED